MSRTIAEAFPPGEFIREEMEAREWSQLDLADILGVRPPALSKLLAGTTKVTALIAEKLSGAFGTSAELWMNYQTTFDLWQASQRDDRVERKAALYSIAPVREMEKRGWIVASDSLDVMESRVAGFLGLSDIASREEPEFLHVARASSSYTVQRGAWLCRARKLAETLTVERFTEKRLDGGIKRLKELMHEPEEARHASRVLAESGVRFVVVEPLPNARIDGACFWIGRTPAIAMSLRYDRIDSFWYTLLHELGHVHHKHALSIDDLDKPEGENEVEKQADEFAASASIDQSQLADFIARVGPMYSFKNIEGFAGKQRVHPGVVVGQLHHRKMLEYSHGRRFLVKVRSHVIQSALTDGWGAMLPSGL